MISQCIFMETDYEISMAPGAKTKIVFYADDRIVWAVESGPMQVNIEGQRVCGEERIPGPGRATSRL